MRLRYGDDAGALFGGFESEIIRVPLINGSYDRSMSLNLTTTLSVPLNSTERGKVRTSTGTYSYSGNLTFELSDELRNLIFTNEFFFRRNFLDIALCDGEGLIEIPGAVWSSLSISGEVGSIITGSLAFQSCNKFVNEIEILPPENPDYSSLPQLEPYWQYGGEGLAGFSLNISRGVNPVYLNELTLITPSYLRVGNMDVNFGVNCWEEWFDHNSIILGERAIEFTSPAWLTAKGWQFAGLSGEGFKTYTNNAASIEGNQLPFNLIGV